jgi:hypothetical protein
VRHGFSFFAAGPTEPQQQKDRRWGQQVGEQDRAGIPRGEIAGANDVADVADTGPDQETCQHQVGREPRLEGAERGVQSGEGDPEIATPTSNWKGLVCHPIACAAFSGKAMWPSAAHKPINPTGKMKAYRSKRSRMKAPATGRGPLTIAIAAPASAATQDSTGMIETTLFCQDRGNRSHTATRHLPAQARGTLEGL